MTKKGGCTVIAKVLPGDPPALMWPQGIAWEIVEEYGSVKQHDNVAVRAVIERSLGRPLKRRERKVFEEILVACLNAHVALETVAHRMGVLGGTER